MTRNEFIALAALVNRPPFWVQLFVTSLTDGAAGYAVALADELEKRHCAPWLDDERKA